MNQIGIYVLKTTKHFYIGLSSNLNKRKYTHFNNLKNGTHSNQLLQNIYNKGYNIEFEIIQECSVEDLNRLEILWMDLYQILYPELEMINLKSGGNRPEYSYQSKCRISKSKCKNEYNFEKRYIVYRELDEEILYVGTLLDISKFLKVDIQHLTTSNKMWNNDLDCYFNIMEELDNEILDSYYGENYF
jgi:predicted GIY-YIG superfamily endonuclease